MYIKSIVIDGFKSYGHRTVIDGFDSEFNAITGLNGSGKSNILDSICFVLGITNLSHVRASNIDDLIFKSGQANINKATVTAIFDNSNPDQCPVGYESVSEISLTRQIVIGGKNKYMINGAAVPSKKVHDLLCSVQLNVNNPHFLIMQGKITKVLSMKPYDILAMIEESAGTKMYEVKKQSAQKTIEKKDAKLNELTSIIENEIEPKLQKFRKERSKYIEFRQLVADLENMLQLYQGWDYLQVKLRVVEAEKALEKSQETLAGWQQDIANNINEIEKIEAEVDKITSKTNAEGKEVITAIEAELKLSSTTQAKSNAAIKSIKDNIVLEKKKYTQLGENLKDEKSALTKKNNELDKVKEFFENLKENDRSNKEALEKCEKRYQALISGKELNEEGEAESLQEQLMHAIKHAANATSEIKQSEVKLKTYRTQLGDKTKQRRSQAGDITKLQGDLNNAVAAVKRLEGSINKLGYSEERMGELKQRRGGLHEQMRSVKDRVDNFLSQRPYTQFRYRDPEPNFNKRSVIGVVCRLIQINSEAAYMAIETAAGGRFYNVVVDSEVTCKKLLQHGDLQQRTTFIPLNKIQGRRVNASIVKTAQDLVGRENCKPALDYLIYDKTLNVVMEYIFGDVLVCKNLDVAKQVAFHPRIKRRCVTLEGDVVNPAGTLSGGAALASGSVFKQLVDIKKYEEELQVKQRELNDLQSELQRLGAQEQEFFTLKNQLKVAETDADLIKKSLQQTAGYLQQEEIENLKQQILQLEENIQTCQNSEKQFNSRVKELQHKIKNTKTNDLIKDAENELARMKRKAQESQQEWQKKEDEYQAFNLEISELEKAIENTEQEIELVGNAVKELEDKLAEAQEGAKEINEQVTEIQEKLSLEKSKIAEKNTEIKKKKQRQSQLQEQISEFELKIKEHNHTLDKVKGEYKLMLAKEKDAEKKASKVNIANAEKLTRDEGKALEARIRTAQDSKSRLERTVNTKAQSMFENQEKEYNELTGKFRIVEQDKKAILQIIKDLDRKKQEILNKAYQQISKDFGSIFGTLLPGANAKLVPPFGQTLLQGLEIKVSLGDVWKQSLTELSGGQRSLAALSLILAMLLFKPAPLYILDEIDAALDLSHTQNIGNMLKTHFKKSQFIIVSLKDGMFKNANVLFRTQFVDGLSSVNRTVNKK